MTHNSSVDPNDNASEPNAGDAYIYGRDGRQAFLSDSGGPSGQSSGGTYWLYMLSNETFQGPLYLGDTSDLSQRLIDHLNGDRRDFAHYHKLERLVYFESWTDPQKFAARLRRVRNWPRDMRLLLIESLNPDWDDLSAKLFESMGIDRQKHIRRRA